MAIADSLIVFVVSLVIGALGIHIGSMIALGESEFGTAVVTALIGALIWGVFAFIFGGIPLLGPLLILLAWIGVINYFYEGGWVDAAVIGIVAWVIVSLILYVLAVMDITAFEAIGIPGS